MVLPFLIGKLPPGSRSKDLLVDTTFGELMDLIDQDLDLRSRIPESQRRKAIEHVLLYLHKQDVLTLNHGMTVMRRAMTIEVEPDKRTGYLKDDYQRLDEHYREKRIQVHVMREYAEVALGSMREARDLVKHYFTLAKQEFIRRYFAGREEVLKLATSEESWRSIVEKLSARSGSSSPMTMTSTAWCWQAPARARHGSSFTALPICYAYAGFRHAASWR